MIPTLNLKLTVTLVAVGLVARAVYRDGPSCAAHNLLGHPLLELVPPLGDAIHKATDPTPGMGWRIERIRSPR